MASFDIIDRELIEKATRPLNLDPDIGRVFIINFHHQPELSLLDFESRDTSILNPMIGFKMIDQDLGRPHRASHHETVPRAARGWRRVASFEQRCHHPATAP